MGLLATLWARVGPTVAIVGAVLAAIVTFGAVQRRAGRQDAAAEATANAFHQAEVRHDIEDDLRRGGAGAVGQLREQWSRD